MVAGHCPFSLYHYLDKFSHPHPIYIPADKYTHMNLGYSRRYPYTNCMSCELRIRLYRHKFCYFRSNGIQNHTNTDTNPNSCCTVGGTDREYLCIHRHQRKPCHRGWFSWIHSSIHSYRNRLYCDILCLPDTPFHRKYDKEKLYFTTWNWCESCYRHLSFELFAFIDILTPLAISIEFMSRLTEAGVTALFISASLIWSTRILVRCTLINV